ncbi:MAG: zinc ribbon domain-containing protein [Patescibacteria group bacterium]|nr:zinc ribbon domain-containing protein [Patescibacteria group bacterium]
MFCSKCGKELSKTANFCSSCGDSIKPVISHNHNQQKIGHWSWGAFGFTWIYLVCMKYKWWWVFLIIVLGTNGLIRSNEIAVSSLGFVISLIVLVYLGIKGRGIAFKYHKWDSHEDYLRAMRIWDIWGIIFFIVTNTIIYGLAFIE